MDWRKRHFDWAELHPKPAAATVHVSDTAVAAAVYSGDKLVVQWVGVDIVMSSWRSVQLVRLGMGLCRLVSGHWVVAVTVVSHPLFCERQPVPQYDGAH
jgi:hypothetical protein